MEKKALTPQILGMYIGCEVAVDKQYESIKYGTLISVSTIDETRNCKVRDKYDEDHSCHLFEIKPILRPLCCATDDERMFLDACGNELPSSDDPLDAIPFFSKGVNYLRSQGIDCDGLLPANLAVEKTK